MSEESKHWAESYVEGFNAADARLISTRALLHQQRAEERVDGDRTWRVDSGYSQLVEKLAVRCNKIQMLTATVARKVTWSKGSVEIEAELQDGDVLLVHARAGIITLPAGVLRRDSVEWEPRPQKLEALQAFEMGHVVRVNFVLKEPVWQDVAPDADFLLSDAPHFPTWWYRCSPSGQLITGWNGGPKASALVGLPRESLFELALDTLSKLFHKSPDYLRARIVSSHFHNWSTDEFSGGAYTYVRAGGFAQSQQMDSPEEDTLWFAGEAAAVEGYWGTVHGAIDSGWRAARSVAAKLFKP
jgi:monoamine oxidase